MELALWYIKIINNIYFEKKENKRKCEVKNIKLLKKIKIKIKINK